MILQGGASRGNWHDRQRVTPLPTNRVGTKSSDVEESFQSCVCREKVQRCKFDRRLTDDRRVLMFDPEYRRLTFDRQTLVRKIENSWFWSTVSAVRSKALRV